MVTPKLFTSSAELASVNTGSLRGGEVAFLADILTTTVSVSTHTGYVLKDPLNNTQTNVSLQFYNNNHVSSTSLNNNNYWLQQNGVTLDLPAQGDIIRVGSEHMYVVSIDDYPSTNPGVSFYWAEITVIRGYYSQELGENTTAVSHPAGGYRLNDNISHVFNIATQRVHGNDGELYMFQPFSGKWQKLQIDSNNTITPS